MIPGHRRDPVVIVFLIVFVTVCGGKDTCIQDSCGSEHSPQYTSHDHHLPTPILAAYANWGQCDEKLLTAARHGVNTLIWFSINLVADESGNPQITGPATGSEFYNCVANVTSQMRNEGLNVVHLISIGGWNSPHPDTQFSPETWFDLWHTWNTKEIARPSLGWNGFAGFDWDIEGNDDGAHHGNVFAQATIDLMGELSVIAKNAGYIVAMAPAQSYMDCSTRNFSRRVDFPPHDPWQADFFYHGRNLYAYLIAKYGIETFDFVSIQLYEGYSSANYEITQENKLPDQYVESFVKCTAKGWEVDFGEAGNLGTIEIRIPTSKLLIGLANGWTTAPPAKFLLIWPEHCGKAYGRLKDEGKEPRGFMFWNVADEGSAVERTGQPRVLWLASSLSEFLF